MLMHISVDFVLSLIYGPLLEFLPFRLSYSKLVFTSGMFDCTNRCVQGSGTVEENKVDE